MDNVKNTKKNPVKLQENKDTKTNKKYPRWFYLILVLTPVLFLVILEATLRLAGYGREYPQWVPYNCDLEGKIELNPEIAYKYFTNTNAVPTSICDPFDKVKENNSFRIFILGESSAAGFPYEPNGSFSRYIRDALQLLYPSKNIEVVNIGISAISSYVIRDLLPGMIEQKPDLVIIYTGHNEYYGALGVSSTESAGSSPFLVNLSLKLSKFKIYKLVANIINSVSAGGNRNARAQSGTLMAQMAKDKLIAYKSGAYYTGIKQFEENLSYMLEECRNHNVPVILSTLISNLKDMQPFESTPDADGKTAADFYKKAQDLITAGNVDEAGKYFIKAKDADALKFRAPSEINDVIIKLGGKYNCRLVNAFDIFNSLSPKGITGSNLIIDHLHPNLNGYQTLGKIFTEEILRAGFIGKPEKTFSIQELDSRVRGNFAFTPLDSSIAYMRLENLKNGYPFNKNYNNSPVNPVLNNIFDSLGYKVAYEGLDWHKAHLQAADYLIKKPDIAGYVKEMNALIRQFPFILTFYDAVENELLQHKEFATAYSFFDEHYKIKPDAFVTKWLGIIDVSRSNLNSGIKHLLESAAFDNSDPQVLFNLAGAYSGKRDYKNALKYINDCISLNPMFPGAYDLKVQLEKIAK